VPFLSDPNYGMTQNMCLWRIQVNLNLKYFVFIFSSSVSVSSFSDENVKVDCEKEMDPIACFQEENRNYDYPENDGGKPLIVAPVYEQMDLRKKIFK
jgi:hypothetical protein